MRKTNGGGATACERFPVEEAQPCTSALSITGEIQMVHFSKLPK
ncbi:hypothetical protein SynSYN20_01696 [Synechococcus sp. SYN20]|nr:hypothetical protein SynSYN20_01696 [Synechococcus sp. SYN20]